MPDKIKPPCGIYGDMLPVYIRGRWVVSMHSMPQDALLGEGFSWADLVELGVADIEYRCPDSIGEIENVELWFQKEMARKQVLLERWSRFGDKEMPPDPKQDASHYKYEGMP